MTNKKEIRAFAKNVKLSLDLDSISYTIQKKVLDLPEIKEADCVMLYMALKDEINVDTVFNALASRGIKCCFPVVKNDTMEAHCFSGSGFRTGAFGISEPVGDLVSPADIDVIIVPGVAFDKNCMRLGRGGGYYDRFLKGLSAVKIGVCPDCLCFDNLPYEAFDVPVDRVVTDKKVVRYGKQE